MEKYSDLDLVGYLCNSCYGGFSFSEEFMNELSKRTNEKYSDDPYISYRPSMRYDPEVIKLFLEMGTERSSGPRSRIRIRYFPREFLNFVYIEEYDGLESVILSFKEIKSKIVDDFLKEWKENSDLTVKDLNDRIENLNYKERRYQDYLKTCIH